MYTRLDVSGVATVALAASAIFAVFKEVAAAPSASAIEKDNPFLKIVFNLKLFFCIVFLPSFFIIWLHYKPERKVCQDIFQSFRVEVCRKKLLKMTNKETNYR